MLHDLIGEHRAQILDLCRRELATLHPARPAETLMPLLREFVDEVRRALAADAGAPETSPLPGRSEAAARLGEERFRSGDEPMDLVNYYGTACEAISEAARRAGAILLARELQVLNRCVDAAIAEAIRQYWIQSNRARHDQDVEAYGQLMHEMRNQLSTAMMAFSLIRSGRTPLDGRTSDLVDRSLSQLEELLAQSLIDVRVQTSASRVRPERVRLSPFLRDLAEALPRERGIALAVEVDQSIELDVDRQLLGSAITNLLQNALKFTAEGGQVVVRGHQSRRTVILEVEDQCGGIPSDKLEAIFEPFVQAGQDRSGLGLGLSIVKEAVLAHGGAIHVANTLNGCVFTVELPAKGDAAPTPPFRQ